MQEPIWGVPNRNGWAQFDRGLRYTLIGISSRDSSAIFNGHESYSAGGVLRHRLTGNCSALPNSPDDNGGVVRHGLGDDRYGVRQASDAVHRRWITTVARTPLRCLGIDAPLAEVHGADDRRCRLSSGIAAWSIQRRSGCCAEISDRGRTSVGIHRPCGAKYWRCCRSTVDTAVSRRLRRASVPSVPALPVDKPLPEWATWSDVSADSLIDYLEGVVAEGHTAEFAQRADTLLGDAHPFDYVGGAASDGVESLAASTNNPNFAAKMLGYDRKTFGQMLHVLKPANGLGPADNLIFHDSGDVEFKGVILDNIHDYAP